MGARNSGSNQQHETEGNKTGADKGNSSTSSTGNNRGRTGGRTGGKRTETVNGSEVLGLADVNESKPKAVTVDVPGADPSEEKPKTRGRPKGSTTKKAAPQKKSDVAAIDSKQVSLLLQTMSAVVATRPGMNVFMLTPDEANQIAQPLANIMSKNEGVGQALGEYADHITLLVAAFTIFIPKFLLFKSQQEMNKPTQLPREVQNEPTTIRSDGANAEQNRNTRNVQNDSSTFNGSISQLIAPIAGY